MKKIGFVGLLAIVLAGSSHAGTITWGYFGDLGGSYQAGWLVELVEDVNKDGIQLGGGAGSGMALYADRSTDSDDTFVTTPVTKALSSGKSGTNWGTTFDSPGSSLALGDNVYSIIYNADSFANATQYIIVDSSPYALPSFNNDADYIQTSLNGSWAPIVPVPEPGTMALFALGLMTLAARRKRR